MRDSDKSGRSANAATAARCGGMSRTTSTHDNTEEG
jgi:hypothetical protein